MCRKLRPIFGKKIDDLYLKYSLVDDIRTKQEIEQAISALYQKYVSKSLLTDNILLEPPEEETIKGEYPLGKVIYAEKELHTFGLREKDWMRHCCITGMSGSGKTTFAFQILGNFIFKNKPFLAFDWKKSFRPLIRLNEKIRIYTIGNEEISNFKFNINKPPKGVNPKEWVSTLADLITETFSGSYGVHKILVDVIDKAFKDFGVYAGSNNYPTWYQIKDRLIEKAESLTTKSRESEWIESTLRIAHALTYGNFGKTICYKGEMEENIEELFNKQTIFELSSLSSTEKKFFSQFILTYIYKWAKAGNTNITNEFKFAILVDEAHNIFLKEKTNFVTESITEVIFREIREYGVSLITLDQHISKLSDVVSGNAACNIAFQQMLPADIEAISKLMQLQEHKEYFTKLPVGTAIVRLAERYYEPFLIRAPNIKLKDTPISDEEIKKRMKEIISNDTKRKLFIKRCQEEKLIKEIMKLKTIQEQAGVKTDEEELRRQALITLNKGTIKAVQEAQKKYEQEEKDKQKPYGLTNHIQQKILDMSKKRMLSGESPEQIKKWFINEGYKRSDVMKTFNYMRRKGIIKKYSKIGEEKIRLSLTEEEKKLITTIMKNPEASISELYKIAGLSPRKGNNTKISLEEKGIIEIDEIKTEKGWKKKPRIIYNDQLITILTQNNKEAEELAT